MKYKHLFFDLDHTLWDFETASERTWRALHLQYKLAERGIADFEAFFAAYSRHNDEMWERFRAGNMSREELRWKRIWQTLLDFDIYDTPLAHEMSSAYLELLPTQAVLIPFAKELLEYCKGRYTLHLITNGFEKTQRLKLEHAGIAGYFREIITSEISDSMKPQPAIFHFAMKVANAACDECLMIGDALDIDVLGAMNVGMDSVYYNPAGLPHNEKPTYEISKLNELMRLI